MNKSLQSLRAPRSRASGFTLVELLITMVIASILFAIAIPSYRTFIQKSRRSDAKSALLDLASLEERYFSVNNVYTIVPANLGYGALPFSVGSGYYQVTTITVTPAVAPTTAAPAGTPASFSIVAVPVPGGPQVGDTACTSFTVTSGGGQTSTGTGTTCWQ
jgi:type IV pilus assembly protein PilE